MKKVCQTLMSVNVLESDAVFLGHTHSVPAQVGHQNPTARRVVSGFPAVQPIAQRVAQPLGQPVVQPRGQRVVQPRGQRVAQPLGQRVVQPTAQPVVQPGGQRVVQPGGQRVVRRVVQSVAKPTGRVGSGNPGVKVVSGMPAVQPVLQPPRKGGSGIRYKSKAGEPIPSNVEVHHSALRKEIGEAVSGLDAALPRDRAAQPDHKDGDVEVTATDPTDTEFSGTDLTETESFGTDLSAGSSGTDFTDAESSGTDFTDTESSGTDLAPNETGLRSWTAPFKLPSFDIGSVIRGLPLFGGGGVSESRSNSVDTDTDLSESQPHHSVDTDTDYEDWHSAHSVQTVLDSESDHDHIKNPNGQLNHGHDDMKWNSGQNWNTYNQGLLDSESDHDHIKNMKWNSGQNWNTYNQGPDEEANQSDEKRHLSALRNAIRKAKRHPGYPKTIAIRVKSSTTHSLTTDVSITHDIDSDAESSATALRVRSSVTDLGGDLDEVPESYHGANSASKFRIS